MTASETAIIALLLSATGIGLSIYFKVREERAKIRITLSTTYSYEFPKPKITIKYRYIRGQKPVTIKEQILLIKKKSPIRILSIKDQLIQVSNEKPEYDFMMNKGDILKSEIIGVKVLTTSGRILYGPGFYRVRSFRRYIFFHDTLRRVFKREKLPYTL